MRFSKLTWSGITCVVLAITICGGWDLWLRTRNTRPVHVPVSLTAGHVHVPEFRINLSGPYEIKIEAKKRIPFEMLNCLLGMPKLASEKCDRPSVVRARWALTSNGVVVAKGISDTEKGGAWANDTIERQIGSFRGKWNRRYILDVDFTADGSALAVTDPHLVVEITSDFYQGSMWMSFLLLLICSAVAIVGAALLLASAAQMIYSLWREKQHITS